MAFFISFHEHLDKLRSPKSPDGFFPTTARLLVLSFVSSFNLFCT